MATVIEIVAAHLVEQGFDGLVNPDIECGCLRDDLAPCGNIGHDCEPGYRGADETGEGDWSMYRTKEQADRSIAMSAPVCRTTTKRTEA